MDSKCLQLVKQMVTLLNGEGLPAGVTVDRNRTQSLQNSDLPRISVWELDEAVDLGGIPNRTAPKVNRVLTVAVAYRVNGNPDALDSLRQWGVRALDSGRVNGTLGIDLREKSTSWKLDEGSDADYSVAVTVYEVRYITWRGDLTKS